MQADPIPNNLKPMLLFNLLYNDTLELAVQPIVNLRTGKVEAVEVLSRAPGGVLLPDEMYRLARQYGVLEQLTLLSCRKLMEKIEFLKPVSSKGIFLNIEADASRYTLEQAAQILSGANGIQIVLEVTEHVPGGFSWRKFAEAKGYFIAMDDVGKGNSNMVELIEMKPHFIKICMEIVGDLHKCGTKAIIVENFKKIGESMNSYVIAEGIENPEDLQKLRELGVEYGQGFHFSRPYLINEISMKEWQAGFAHKL